MARGAGLDLRGTRLALRPSRPAMPRGRRSARQAPQTLGTPQLVSSASVHITAGSEGNQRLHAIRSYSPTSPASARAASDPTGGGPAPWSSTVSPVSKM